jgi:tetratricopeptide (TPR) repeat protein
MTYLLAAGDYAAGQFAAAAEQIRAVPFSAKSVPLQFLLAQAQVSPHPTMSDTTTMWESRRSACKTLLNTIASSRALGQVDDARAAQKKLDGCAPESLDYAQSLSGDGNHAEAVRSLQRLLAAAPLNRAARELLVRDLQLAGEDEAAQQAAAEWIRIAPNAEDYHRLAAEWSEGTPYHDIGPASDSKGFYLPYRRDAAVLAPQSANLTASGSTLMLVDDHVAIARPDGSVSVYVHRATRALTDGATVQLSAARIPRDAQVLALRIVHPDGSTAALNNAGMLQSALAPGDAIDEEYILNYSGDGGIAEHAEAFQFVFGSFDQQVVYSRFVVLTPAVRADRGAVISTGEVPAMTTTVRNGMVERIWEKKPAPDTAALSSGAALAIVRVVEDEHGWSEPSSAEHRHKIETIHPGPRPSDS